MALHKRKATMGKISKTLAKLNETLGQLNRTLPKLNEIIGKLNRTLPKLNEMTGCFQCSFGQNSQSLASAGGAGVPV
eukprot:7287774-Pyramimonas_sp.AAC.1